MSVAIPSGNDPFGGGSKTNNSPPTAVAGSIAPAQTGVSNPAAGVNAGTPFFARNNRGSNIGIPYSRLCPLGGERSMMGLGPPPGTAPKDPNVKVQVTETDDLRSTKLAFILGRRSSAMAGVQPGATGAALSAGRNFNNDPGMLPDDTDYGFQLAIHNEYAPGVPGTERFQKLCSFEYLHRYFTNVLCNKAVVLSKRLLEPNDAAGWAALTAKWDTGVLRQTIGLTNRNTAANDANTNPGPAGLLYDTRVHLGNSSMMAVPDLAQEFALQGSDGADTNKTPKLRQGIFARDTGPFLRGKGSGGTGMIACTHAGVPQVVAGQTLATQPYHLSRCMGDEVAFAQLERQLEQLGITDWRPDGIVLSLGANDPSDKLSDEALSARDGQLFNVRIQGPAVGSSWTGNPALEVLPLDKVFVVLVADVWWDVPAATTKNVGAGLMGGGTAKTFAKNAKDVDDEDLGAVAAFLDVVAPRGGGAPSRPTRDQLEAYLAAKKNLFSATSASKLTKDDVSIATSTFAGGDFTKRAKNAFEGAASDKAGNVDAGKPNGEATRMVNFRPMFATSSQMINYSTLKFDQSGNQQAGSEIEANAFARVPGQSRMGLRLARDGGEYIVGGWCIGNVLDTSASRAAFPGAGTNIGVRTAPNTAALNVNVQIDWWDSDRMWRSFMNVEDACKPRYVKTPSKDAAVRNAINRNPNDYGPAAMPKPLAYA